MGVDFSRAYETTSRKTRTSRALAHYFRSPLKSDFLLEVTICRVGLFPFDSPAVLLFPALDTLSSLADDARLARQSNGGTMRTHSLAHKEPSAKQESSELRKKRQVPVRSLKE